MAKSTDSPRKDTSGDPSLPHKKRARRRLVGAAAIGLAVAIGLPMVLDSEPKREPSDVKVQIPSRDTPLKSATPGAGALPPPTAAGSQASGTITIPSSPSATPPPADKAASQKPAADARTGDAAAKTAEKQAAEKRAAEAKLAEAKLAEAKKAAEARKAADSKLADTKGPDGKSTAAKAPEKHTDKPADKGVDKVPAGGKQFLLQAGAFSSEKSASDQAARVKEAGLRAYTEKVKTADGERVRVRVGPFPNREAAEQARGQLKLSGIDSAVIVP